ncbi:TldD/PmbA family protein [Candidatus Woesearchaeota archaeon]|nr:TldD/PmbA family protein [Candidatus Woesearchaeota archaeon]
MIEDAYIKKKVKDYEIYYSELNKEQYDFTNKDINFISNNENSGFGVRILKNKRIGFASTNTNNLKKCIDKAIEICSLNNENNNFKNFALPSEKYTNVNSFNKTLIDFDGEDIKDFISEIRKENVNITEAIYLKTEGVVKIINSNGIDKESKFCTNSLSLEIKEDNNSIYFGIDDVFPINIDIVKEWIERLKNQKDKKKIKNFQGDVLFSEETLASLLDNILSYNLSGENIFYNRSGFCNKINKKVFSEKITIIDEPLTLNRVNTRSFDAEGVACKNLSLIENGILKNYLFDSYYGNLMNKNGGNTFRGIFSLPFISLSNITMKKGNKNDLVREIDRGLIVNGLMGVHTMDAVSGNFSLAVSEGFFVKNGAIECALKDCMIAGNFFEMMNNVLNVGNSLKNVSSGFYLPKVLCSNVNVIGN